LGFLRPRDANRNTSYISTVSDVGICILPSSFAVGLSLLFLTPHLHILWGGFLPLHYQPRACHMPSCHNIYAPPHCLLRIFFCILNVASTHCFSLFFTCFSVSSAVVLPSNSAVLCYILDAQLFLLPQHVSHGKSSRISLTFLLFAFKYTTKNQFVLTVWSFIIIPKDDLADSETFALLE
jgi:hypothetical protein